MAKLHVYELAMEFDLDSAIVMEELESIDAPARSASATIEARDVDLLRPRLERRRGERSNERRSAFRVPARRAAPDGGADPFGAATKRRREPSVQKRQLPPLEQMLADHMRLRDVVQGRVVVLLREQARAWAETMIDPAEVRQWLAVDATPAQALECVKSGVTPDLMKQPFTLLRMAPDVGPLANMEAYRDGIATPAEIAAGRAG